MLSNYIKAAMLMARGGICWTSIAAYPFRRRVGKRACQLDLKNGLSICSPPGEPLPHIFQEVWVEGRYMRWPEAVNDGDAIIDVGSHVGVFALWAATHFPRSSVIAIEPSIRLFEYLRENVARNHIQNLLPVHSACGASAGEAKLFGRGPHAMNTFYQRDNYRSSFTTLERVTVKPLAEIFERYLIRYCGLLKLDCEGAEYEILLNTPTGFLRRVRAISMEYHIGLNDHTPQELSCFLRSQGFDVEFEPLMDEEGGYLYARNTPG